MQLRSQRGRTRDNEGELYVISSLRSDLKDDVFINVAVYLVQMVTTDLRRVSIEREITVGSSLWHRLPAFLYPTSHFVTLPCQLVWQEAKIRKLDTAPTPRMALN